MLMMDRIQLAMLGARKCGMKEPILILGPQAVEEVRKEIVDRTHRYMPAGVYPAEIFGMRVVGNKNKGDRFDVVEGAPR
jgi:hypothetical protein